MWAVWNSMSCILKAKRQPSCGVQRCCPEPTFATPVGHLSFSFSLSQIWTSVSSFPLFVQGTGPSASTRMVDIVAVATSAATEALSPMRMAQPVLVSDDSGRAESCESSLRPSLGLSEVSQWKHGPGSRVLALFQGTNSLSVAIFFCIDQSRARAMGRGKQAS